MNSFSLLNCETTEKHFALVKCASLGVGHIGQKRNTQQFGGNLESNAQDQAWS